MNFEFPGAVPCRMFLTDDSFREQYRNNGPVLVWLNLDSKEHNLLNSKFSRFIL
jgi:hypothetical protein